MLHCVPPVFLCYEYFTAQAPSEEENEMDGFVEISSCFLIAIFLLCILLILPKRKTSAQNEQTLLRKTGIAIQLIWLY
jgi:DMSO/TMAO reductase YedYZ heme-binding membrane subunit